MAKSTLSKCYEALIAGEVVYLVGSQLLTNKMCERMTYSVREMAIKDCEDARQYFSTDMARKILPCYHTLGLTFSSEEEPELTIDRYVQDKYSDSEDTHWNMVTFIPDPQLLMTIADLMGMHKKSMKKRR